jgi:hypothetical protein
MKERVGLTQSRKKHHNYSIRFKIPEYITTKFFMAAFISYNCDTAYDTNIGGYSFRFSNSSCESNMGVNDAHLFQEIPSNCNIINFNHKDYPPQCDNHIGVSKGKNQVGNIYKTFGTWYKC